MANGSNKDLEKSLNGSYLNERLEKTFGTDFTKEQMEALKKKSLSEEISVRKSINSIRQRCAAYGWDVEEVSNQNGNMQLKFSLKSNGKELASFNYDIILEGGSLPGVAKNGEHTEINTLIYYKTDKGVEGLCTVQEAELDQLRQFLDSKDSKLSKLMASFTTKTLKTGKADQTILKRISDYTYPATKVRDVSPLGLSKAQVEKADAEAAKNNKADAMNIAKTFNQARTLDMSFYIRQVSTEHKREIIEARKAALNKDKLTSWETSKATRDFEEKINNLYAQLSSTPLEGRAAVLEAFEKANPEIKNFSSWQGIKASAQEFATAIRGTYTNTSQTANAKMKINIGRNVALNPGGEYSQGGAKGEKQGANARTLANSNSKPISGQVNINSGSAALKHYAGGSVSSSNRGLTSANLSNRKGGSETRKSFIERFAGKEIDTSIQQAIQHHIQNRNLTEKQKKKLIDMMNDALKTNKSLTAGQLTQILGEEGFSYGTDAEQFLVTQGTANSGIFTQVLNEKMIDTASDSEFKAKFDKEIENVKKKFKKSPKKDDEKFIKSEAYKKVFGLDGDWDFEEIVDADGISKVRAREIKKFETGDKIYSASGEHGIATVISDLAMIENLLEEGYSAADILDENGNVKVNISTQRIKSDKADRKANTFATQIMNEFVVKGIKKDESLDSIRNRYEESFKTVISAALTDEQKKILDIDKDNSGKFTKLYNTIAKEFIQSFENGEYTFGNIYAIMDKVFSSNEFSDEQKKILGGIIPYMNLAALVNSLGDKSEFKFENGTITSRKDSGSYLSYENFNIGDIPEYGDPTSKGGKPISLGKKAVSDLKRQAASVKKRNNAINLNTYEKAIDLIYSRNKNLDTAEIANIPNVIDETIRKSINVKKEDLKNNNKAFLYEGLEDEFANLDPDSQLKSGEIEGIGRTGYEVNSFMNSYLGKIYKEQLSGKDVYLDLAYTGQDEDGNTVTSEAINVMDFSRAFVGIDNDGNIYEDILDKDGKLIPGITHIIPADTASGALAIQEAARIANIVKTYHSDKDLIESTADTKTKKRLEGDKNRHIIESILYHQNQYKDKDSALSENIDKAGISHSAALRATAIDTESNLSKVKHGATVVSPKVLKDMLKKISKTEDPKAYLTMLKKQAEQLGIDTTELTDEKDQKGINKLIKSIVQKVDIAGKSEEEIKKMSGIISAITRYPLLTGENVPFTELFVDSSAKKGNTVSTDPMIAKMLNADFDGDILNLFSTILRPELVGNMSEEELTEYLDANKETFKMFQERIEIMKELAKQAGSKSQKRPANEVLSIEQLGSKYNISTDVLSGAAEKATRANQNAVGHFDLMRQAYLNFNELNNRDWNENSLITSDFLTALPQETISAKKVFSKMFETLKNNNTEGKSDEELMKAAEIATSDAIAEISGFLKDPELYSNENKWKEFGKALDKWGLADIGDGVAFSEDRALSMAARLYQATGDEKWKDWKTVQKEFSFEGLGRHVRAENQALKGHIYRDKNGTNRTFANGLSDIVNAGYNYNPGDLQETAENFANKYGDEVQQLPKTIDELVKSLIGMSAPLKNLDKLTKEFIEQSKDIPGIIEKFSQANKTPYSLSATALTKKAGINTYNAPSFASEDVQNIYMDIMKNGAGALSQYDEATRNAIIKQVDATWIGNANNIGQTLFKIKTAKAEPGEENPFKDITSLEDFYKVYENNKDYKIDGAKTVADFWEGSDALSIEEFIKKAKTDLGLEGNFDYQGIIAKLREYDSTGVGGQKEKANELLDLSHNLIGGPAQQLLFMKQLDELMGKSTGDKSSYYNITQRNLANDLAFTKGLNFVGEEIPLFTARNFGNEENGSNVHGIYGFADILATDKNGNSILADLKSGKNIDDILKPEYIAQLGIYATMMKDMKALIGENTTYDDFLKTDAAGRAKQLTHKDLTEEEFNFIKNLNMDKLQHEIWGTDRNGNATKWVASYKDLGGTRFSELIEQMIAKGFGIGDEGFLQLLQGEDFKQLFEQVKGSFKIDMDSYHVEKGAGSGSSKGKKISKEDLKKFYAFLNEIESVKAQIDEIKRLREEAKTEEEKKKYDDELESLSRQKGRLNRNKNKYFKEKGWTDEDQKFAKEQWKNEKLLPDSKKTPSTADREEAAALRGLRADYREYNRYALSLKSNKNRQAMTMDEVELASLREQEEAIKESLQASEERVKLAEESYKKQGFSTDKLNEIKDKADKSLKLALAGENVRNKGQSTFWGQLSQQLNRTFTNFMRFGLVSKVMQTVRRSIQKVVQAAKELDKAMTNLRIVSGANADQAKQMINDYAQLAKQIGATTTEVATSANEWFNKLSRSLTNKLL